ncbi:dynein regulatory complex subunit 3 [Channa argus]|uniref:dynein regulatory complex subunit 3 n=1 Tax=Channa argus TaxID=215402 RepID=UPI0029472D0F|nr:hypothetical protein Q8A73_016381 [Channa argus]
MSEFYGGSEPIVMDEEFLQKVAVEHTPQNLAGIIKREGIHFDEVLELSLEYRNILIIDNLREFTSLEKLYLNNNLIEKIEGLDRLINLTCLNLSFNKIQKIEGLESLQKLEVLNLANNRIAIIENMDKLEKLTHFCIANNLIEQLDNVLYMRKFKNLFTLTLFGNPVSEADDYKLFIAAYFPNLTCLDYKIVNEKTKNDAYIKYQYVLEEMRRKEKQEQQAINADESQKADLQLHTDAFVEFLNGSYLFESMFKDDPELETLQHLPEVPELLQTFENEMVELCMQLFNIGLAEHKLRETEVKTFFSGEAKTVADCQQKASQILAKFEQQHQQRIEELEQLSDSNAIKEKIRCCNDEINQLCKSFMSLEFLLVSQLEDIITMLERNISHMVGNFSDNTQRIFALCRDLEQNYFQNVRNIALATLEKIAKDNLEEDMSDDVRMLFTDKDTVMNALTAGHDNHLIKINDRETLLGTRLNAWKVALIKGIQDKQLKQHRMRFSDIHRYADYLREQLAKFL